MKFELLSIIILGLFFSFQAKAENPPFPEPEFIKIDNAKDYYIKSYGYNTKETCSGETCLPVGSEVGCSYDYKNGGVRGTRLQVCNLKTIKNIDGAVTDVSRNKYMMVTGIINQKNEFSNILPENEVFLATRWRVKKYEPSSQPTISQAPVKNPFGSPEAGVCVSGMDCYKEDPCENPGSLNSLLCSQKPMKVDPILTPRSEKLDKQEIGAAFSHFASSCDNFITPSGELGIRGKKTLNAIKEVGPSCFDGSKGSIDVTNVCPNFKNFSQQQKDYFWVWVYASMAQEESTCGVSLHNKHAANGDGNGLFQMENRIWRKKNGRDRRYCPWEKIDSNNEDFQFRCTVSVMVDTNCKKGWELSSTHGYWAELRGLATYYYKKKKIRPEISWNIMKFPGCKGK